MDVDAGAGVADHLADDRSPRDSLPARAAACSHDDLRRVQGPRGLEQRVPDVGAGDLVIRAAELLHQLALPLEELRRGRRQAVLRNHVDGDELALRPLCDAGSAADDALAVGRTGERDDHALTRLPGLHDPVPRAVLGKRFVHTVGKPCERELSQRRKVAGTEVVGECGVDPLGRVDVPAGEPIAERIRREVDELELVGLADDRIGDRLALFDARDLLDDVVQRLEVLDVQRRDHVDPGPQQLLHVLPALLVTRAGHVRVRELVHERDLGPAREDRVDVHLFELGVAVTEALSRHHLEVGDLVGGLPPTVCLDEARHDVLAVVAAAPALVQHREGLADAGCGAEVDPERSARHKGRLRLRFAVLTCDRLVTYHASHDRRRPRVQGAGRPDAALPARPALRA